MNSYVRKFDKLGRIVLPISYRNNLSIKARDKILLKTANNAIVIKKYIGPEYYCIFCGSKTSFKFSEKYICQECKSNLANQY